MFVLVIKSLKLLNSNYMSTFEIKMPKMGESVQEATITKWFVENGQIIERVQSYRHQGQGW